MKSLLLRFHGPCLLLGLAAAGLGLPAQESRPALRRDEADGLPIVHLYGDARTRGEALGRALADEVVAVVRAEFRERFAAREALFAQMRHRIEPMIAFPAEQRQEIEGLYAGLVASGRDLRLPEFERDLDLADLLVANALDVFAGIGCSGFTVCGDRVAGGGVLTGRNFDWFYTGPHLVEQAILLVVHPPDGRAHAFLTWPGYFGAITAVQEDGMALFLHVGSGKLALVPRKGAWPTASAARELLRLAPAAAITQALPLLARTSPPASYLTRLVLPYAPQDGCPELVFEADTRQVVRRQVAGACCITTNHFCARGDGREPSGDSLQRYAEIEQELGRCFGEGDHRLSLGEAWAALRSVDRSGRGFGTLHALVFRNDPWHFEVKLGVPNGAAKVKSAHTAVRSHVLAREKLFGVPPAASRR